MTDIDYQGIYDVISDTLPNGWIKIVVHFLRWSGSSETVYYVKTQHEDYKDCYSLGIPDEVLMNKSIKLLSIVKKDENQWKALTLTICSDGTFDAKADYTSNIDETEKYMKSWTDTYLK